MLLLLVEEPLPPVHLAPERPQSGPIRHPAANPLAETPHNKEGKAPIQCHCITNLKRTHRLSKCPQLCNRSVMFSITVPVTEITPHHSQFSYRCRFAFRCVILAVAGRFHSAILIGRNFVLIHFIHQHNLGIGIHSHTHGLLCCVAKTSQAKHFLHSTSPEIKRKLARFIKLSRFTSEL